MQKWRYNGYLEAVRNCGTHAGLSPTCKDTVIMKTWNSLALELNRVSRNGLEQRNVYGRNISERYIGNTSFRSGVHINKFKMRIMLCTPMPTQIL